MATDGSATLRGSGLAFESKGRSYVLTSDHVVLHDNDRRRHVIHFDRGVAIECEYLVSDFGRGLALLQVIGPYDAAMTEELTLISASTPTTSTRVAVMGYPAMSAGLVRDARGLVSNPSLATNTLVQTREIIEISGAHGEFGMSGGVVATLDEKFVGILSHQVYSETPNSISNKILVIPGVTALAWAKSVLDAPADLAPIQFAQFTSQLLWKSSLTLSSRHLMFLWHDPFGTGRNLFSLNDLTQSGSPEIVGGETGPLASLEAKLQASSCNGYLMGFRERKPFGPSVSTPRDPIGTLRLLDDPALEPVVQLFCNESRDAVDELESHEQKLESLIAKLSASDAPRLILHIRAAIDIIRNHQSADVSTHHYHWLKPRDLDWLMTSPELGPEWSRLTTTGQATVLREALSKLRATMSFLSE